MNAHREKLVSAATYLFLLTVSVLLLSEASGQNVIPEFKATSDDGTKDVKEYCQFEAFNVSCPEGSLVLMTKARYGRMRVGKCVRGDYGYIGCAADVLAYMDKICSGQPSCVLDIPKLEEAAKPCPEDFKAYLEASYQCVTAFTGSSQECRENHFVQLEEKTGFLATSVTEATGFGSASCPWHIKLPKGQKIEFTFFNFQVISDERIAQDSDSLSSCPLYVVVREKDNNIDFDLCQRFERQGHLFTSKTNEVEIYFTSPVTQPVTQKYMLQYTGTGCPDIVPPRNTLIRRHGDTASVRCNRTQETWYVTCKGNSWIGEIGNCSHAQKWTATTYKRRSAIPHGIIMAVIIGILLGVLIGTILLIIVFTIRRKQKLEAQKKEDPLLQVATVGTFNKDVVPCPGSNHYHHKITVGDQAYNQQSTPLMATYDPEIQVTQDGQTVARNPDGSYPPPYDSDWGSRAQVPSRLERAQSHESPRQNRQIKREIPLPDLPVYFELDPHTTNTKDMMANSAHAMALRSAQSTEYGLEGRYSA